MFRSQNQHRLFVGRLTIHEFHLVKVVFGDHIQHRQENTRTFSNGANRISKPNAARIICISIYNTRSSWGDGIHVLNTYKKEKT